MSYGRSEPDMNEMQGKCTKSEVIRSQWRRYPESGQGDVEHQVEVGDFTLRAGAKANSRFPAPTMGCTVGSLW